MSQPQGWLDQFARESSQGRFLKVLGLLLAFLAFVPESMAIPKKKYDFVIGVHGDFKAAIAAAAANASASNRFYIFFPDGEYNIGTLTGDANQKTTFSTSNVSFIGQSTDKTVVYNKSINEGISITATLYFYNADNLYLQDLTVYNKANYGDVASYSQTGRHVAIQEQSKKVVYKNVKLLSTQDTYYSKGTKTYWENGEIHGTTDFICGSGDVYFNECKLLALKKSALTAPSSTNNTWGYVFKNCTIDGNSGVAGYTLGRSWNDAKAVFIGTTMNVLPSDAGWGDPMNSVPKVFAEYQSKNTAGALMDLSKRRTSYTKGATTVTLNPRLSDPEAANYTVANVLAGTDNWQPQSLAQQVDPPVIRQEGTSLLWEDNTNALCWAIFKNGQYLANVITTSYDVSLLASGDVLTVRAANQMGGLGASSNAVTIGAGPQQSLSVSVVQGQGTISPANGFYSQGAALSLTATPSKDWLFDRWAGDISGTANPSPVVMDANKTITVYFLPVDPLNYQAEFGILSDAVQESKNAGFTGEGYANFNNVPGAAVAIPVYGSQAGTIPVTIVYANGSGITRQLSISVNGVVQTASLDFEATANWTTWGTKEINLPLRQGANTITFATVNSNDGPNIDRITLGQGPTAIAPGGISRTPTHRYDATGKTLRIRGSGVGRWNLRIYTMAGALVISKHLDFSATSQNLEISLSALQPGAYLLQYDGVGIVGNGLLDVR